MRRRRDNVVIQEPPIQEIGKRRSCLKRTCLTGCGCIVLFIIGIVVLLQVLAGPRSSKVKDLPFNVTNAIPLYDKDSIVDITVIPGVEKNKLLETAALIPKVFLSPIILSLDSQFAPAEADNGRWARFRAFIDEPIGDHRDTYTLRWEDLPARPTFVLDFYKRELVRQGFVISSEYTGTRNYSFTFSRGTIQGDLRIEDDPRFAGTNILILTLIIPQ